MNAFITAAAVAGVLGLVLLAFALRVRARLGLGLGESVALDDVTLHSPRLGLTGRPDRIVKRGGAYTPEEWKSSRRVSHGHRLQLATYFLLIEEVYGVRPAYGVVVLGGGARVKVPNTAALRAEVLAIADKIRERKVALSRPVLVNQPASKCRGCGQRANCDQASG